MVDDEIAGAEGRKLLGCRFDRVPGRPGDRQPGLVLEVRPVELPELAEICQVELSFQRIDNLVCHAQPLLQPLAHRLRHRLRHLEPCHLPEPCAAKLELDGFEQVVGLVRDLEIAVARDTEQRALEDLHPGEKLR